MEELQKEDFEDLGYISLVLEGKNEAFTPLVVKYERLIFKIAFNFLGKNGELEDAVQEIFLEAYKSLPGFRLGKRFLPWLYAIALNVLRKRYRKNLQKKEMEAAIKQQDINPEPHPVELMEKKLLRQQIRGKVQALPRILREVILLYYMQDLNINEICAILNLSAANVKSRLFRARKKLKNLLTKVQRNSENGQ